MNGYASRCRGGLARRLSRLVAAGVLLWAVSGCGNIDTDELSTEYGSRQTVRSGNSSVNGVAVLAEMYEKAGHRVTTARRFSPSVEQADTIVWFLTDGGPPNQAAIDWLEDWLYSDSNRCLVLVPRDFDAAPLYWRKVQKLAPQQQQADIQTRISPADTRAQISRSRLPTGVSDWNWFEYDSTYRPRQVRTLRGDPAWTRGVNAADLEIELASRLVAKDAFFDTVLLASEDDLLVISQQSGQSKVIAVVNGSFLLNLPLINKEHRKLAGSLIQESAPQNDSMVVFLEGGGDVAVADEDEAEGPPTTWKVLNTPPISYLFRTMALFSAVLIFALWPIFGIPREESHRHLSDFGRHIEALGKLLARRGDARHAWSRIALYRQLAEPGGGMSGRRGSAAASPPQAAPPASAPPLNPTSGPPPTGTGPPEVGPPSGMSPG